MTNFTHCNQRFSVHSRVVIRRSVATTIWVNTCAFTSTRDSGAFVSARAIRVHVSKGLDIDRRL